MKGAGSYVVIATLVVGRAIDDASQLGPAKGAGTHRTRFDGDVERAVGQVFTAQLVGGSGDGLHLGVGGDVAERLRQVVGAGNNAVLAYDDRANGYLSLAIGSLGLREGALHVVFVAFLLFFCLCDVAKVVNYYIIIA